jgi:hypothetical protein
MNRKKQKIINDSILGALIPRNTGEKNNTECYFYSHFIVMVMQNIDSIVKEYSIYPNNIVKVLFLQEIHQIV